MLAISTCRRKLRAVPSTVTFLQATETMVASVSSPPTEFQPDDIVEGRYRIIRKLADGGMGTVFLAEHVLIKRRVALKLLHAELAADGAMVKRFMNEAAAAGMLGHPHIVESTDMGFTSGGVPYIVFEYLEGCLLTEEVYRLGGLPVRRAVQLASQIASALEAAHAAQIAHLDLKSDNVFLIDRGDSHDHVKVLDFGISRFMAVDADKTHRAILMGTPEFMAPEQITTPDLVDGRADIYALGVLLYEMLTARRPYVHDDPRILLHRIVHEPPPPLGRRVPASLEHLLFHQMLAKSRDQRIQTMHEVKTILDEIAFVARPEVPEPSSTFDEPNLAREVPVDATVPAASLAVPAALATPVVLASSVASVAAPAALPERLPHPGWMVAGLAASLAGCVVWYAEAQQASVLRAGMLRNLRGGIWAAGVVLLTIYVIASLMFRRRADAASEGSATGHPSSMKRTSWAQVDQVSPGRLATGRARR